MIPKALELLIWENGFSGILNWGGTSEPYNMDYTNDGHRWSVLNVARKIGLSERGEVRIPSGPEGSTNRNKSGSSGIPSSPSMILRSRFCFHFTFRLLGTSFSQRSHSQSFCILPLKNALFHFLAPNNSLLQRQNSTTLLYLRRKWIPANWFLEGSPCSRKLS